jgi:hypothetical protein
MVHNELNNVEVPPFYPTTNSCVFHEHPRIDKDGCRERIKNKAHVFAELITSCAKDGTAIG